MGFLWSVLDLCPFSTNISMNFHIQDLVYRNKILGMCDLHFNSTSVFCQIYLNQAGDVGTRYSGRTCCARCGLPASDFRVFPEFVSVCPTFSSSSLLAILPKTRSFRQPHRVWTLLFLYFS